MLQPFMRMRYIPVLRYVSFKEIFCFFYFPYTETGSFANAMLKKNRHTSAFHHYFAAHRLY